ncbi:MAG: hypothetical protein JST20_11300 [Bacteroidetes bacterium]|nr:hypothetical protein [Bacteroidota bacterium]
MKIIVVLFSLLLVLVSGCFLFQGSLYRSNLKVVLIKDNPGFVGKDSDEKPSGYLGTLPLRIGDTITTIGRYSGGFEATYYLILEHQKEVYISRADVLTPDDQLYQRLRSRFTLSFSEDEAAWGRASVYVKNHTVIPIGIVSENLLKTQSNNDSTAINYLITRVEQSNNVEYEIVCRSRRPDFNPNMEAKQLAFYMITGRKYTTDN